MDPAFTEEVSRRVTETSKMRLRPAEGQHELYLSVPYYWFGRVPSALGGYQQLAGGLSLKGAETWPISQWEAAVCSSARNTGSQCSACGKVRFPDRLRPAEWLHACLRLCGLSSLPLVSMKVLPHCFLQDLYLRTLGVCAPF